jgi:hypothetical protein
MLDEERDVLDPLTQRREVYGMTLSRSRGLHGTFPPRLPPRGSCCRRNDPDIGPDGFDPADSFELTLLNDPEQLDLEVRAHLGDLVEEDAAAARELESADPRPECPGEGSLLVPEELAFKQLLRDGPAMTGTKGFAALRS